MKKESVRVIFDTNVWISFLIGKRLKNIRYLIADRSIVLITTDQLKLEIKEVTDRPKLKKYFPKRSVIELMNLLNAIAEDVKIKPRFDISRDPKDNFLLDLCHYSKADFLVTGDKDLLEHDPFNNCRIVTPAEFEKELNLK